MQLYNTMGRKKEHFVPIIPGKVGIYTCGITAYALSHIGHARSAIVFDILVRLLRYKGYDVTFIRNFTDIDDKIIDRAQVESRTSSEVAEEFIQAFHEDMQCLNVIQADVEPKATEHIPEMIKICELLLEKGHAYITASGDVCFRVRSFPEYGKLSGRTLDELYVGVRVIHDEEKEYPLDFVLWKASKPGEPSWDSPWSKGRPGWHIECSAMSERYYKLPLDIHGGGLDLIFPHHENEIAQTEAALDKPLAKIWMHNGFVQVNTEKMSKSLGNFKTIRDILKVYLPETLRFFLLSKHYRSPIDFSFDAMIEIEQGQKRIYTCLLEVSKVFCDNAWDAHIEIDISNTLQELNEQDVLFMDALEDDCNTAAAVGHIFTAIKIGRRVIDDKKGMKSISTKKFFEKFNEMHKKWKDILGVFDQEPGMFLQQLKNIRIIRKDINMEQVEVLLKQRKVAKEQKDFIKSDSIRSKLMSLGIEVQDSLEGQLWDVL